MSVSSRVVSLTLVVPKLGLKLAGRVTPDDLPSRLIESAVGAALALRQGGLLVRSLLGHPAPGTSEADTMAAWAAAAEPEEVSPLDDDEVLEEVVVLAQVLEAEAQAEDEADAAGEAAEDAVADVVAELVTEVVTEAVAEAVADLVAEADAEEQAGEQAGEGEEVELVISSPVAPAEQVEHGETIAHDALPLPDYDHLTLGSLRARLRSLSPEQLAVLRDYERAHANRLQVVTLFDNRLAKLAAAE